MDLRPRFFGTLTGREEPFSDGPGPSLGPLGMESLRTETFFRGFRPRECFFMAGIADGTSFERVETGIGEGHGSSAWKERKKVLS